MTITAEARAKAAEARAEAHTKTRLTTRPGSEETVLRPGDVVKIVGARKPYTGRKATVVAVNRQEFPHDRGIYTELGVRFDGVLDEHLTSLSAHAWFRDDELVPA